MAELKHQIRDDHSTNEAESENQTNLNIASEPNRPGFFSLPPELRLMVYRELLLEPRICHMWLDFSPKPPLLQTCRLIYYEAFEVLWGENTFRYYFNPPEGPLPDPFRLRVVDTITRLVFDNTIGHKFSQDSNEGDRKLNDDRFKELIREFGNPARIRRYLQVNLKIFDLFHLNDSHVGTYVIDEEPLERYLKDVGTFTNFRTVEVNVEFPSRRYDSLQHTEPIARVLQPRFGTSRLCAPHGLGWGLQFHPQDHLRSQRAQDIVDPTDVWDGYRCGWIDMTTPIFGMSEYERSDALDIQKKEAAERVAQRAMEWANRRPKRKKKGTNWTVKKSKKKA